MRRKVIQIANSTQLVSLPRKWAKRNGIAKGDELELSEREGGLFISPADSSNKTIQTVSYDVSGMKSYIDKVVGALYKAGYDELELRFSKQEELDRILEVMGYTCIGFEAIEQKKNTVIIRKISTPMPEEFTNIFRRMILLLISISEQGLVTIENEDFDTLKNIMLLDLSVNRFANFCRRTINREGHPTPERPAPLYCLVECLEELGDAYKALFHDYEKYRPKRKEFSEQLIECIRKSTVLLREFKALNAQQKGSNSEKYLVALKEEKGKITEFITTCKKEEIAVALHLRDIITKLKECAGPQLLLGI